jgi:hypothetical protein
VHMFRVTTKGTLVGSTLSADGQQDGDPTAGTRSSPSSSGIRPMFVLTSDMSQNKVHCAHGGSGLTLRVVRGDPSMEFLCIKLA